MLTIISQSAVQTRRLVRLGCLRALLALLRRAPPAAGTLHAALRSLFLIFDRGDGPLDNPYAAEFRREGGEPVVRALRRHSCARIAACALRMREYLAAPASAARTI